MTWKLKGNADLFTFIVFSEKIEHLSFTFFTLVHKGSASIVAGETEFVTSRMK